MKKSGRREHDELQMLNREIIMINLFEVGK
jgi:hypothetical protein